MKIQNLIFILSFFAFLPNICFGETTNLDEIYREIVKADNEDYLPLFVKNREAPNFLKDIENVENITPEESENNENVIFFENKIAKRTAQQKAEELKWQAVILAIQQDKVTPFEIEIINNRIKRKDPQATELLAFMNAKGIGVEQDLIESFMLYKKAYNLGVENAKKSAVLVYKSMNNYQKQKLKSINVE
ncbi:MAG: SEL1-like repeat protein [Alphaproteobacteria bacterium]